jgi:hypothetical protein
MVVHRGNVMPIDASTSGRALLAALMIVVLLLFTVALAGVIGPSN